VIHGTLKGIAEGKSTSLAFAEAAEDQNYHGTRPDIVRERNKQANHLWSKYRVKVSDEAIANIENEMAGMHTPSRSGSKIVSGKRSKGKRSRSADVTIGRAR